MPRSRLIAAILLALTLPACADKARKPVQPTPAQQYPLRDTHENEHVTIAAEPCTTKETTPNFRLKYADHGMLPIHVIVTNDSDLAVNLDDARIHFIAADGSSISAATDGDLQRALFTIKGATGTRLPLGLPIPITVGKKNVDKKIIDDDKDFGFQTTTVAPHTTVDGYLFYDVSQLDQPILDHATLELRKVRLMLNNKALDSFEIPLGSKSDKPATDESKSSAKP
jgi:hypothetical protein